MTPENIPVREEKIEALADFSADLAEACRRCHSTNTKVTDAVGAALSAECPKCGIHVSGAELLATSTSADDPSAHAKIKRMRLGFCARDGCEALVYRLHFGQAPELDWKTVLGQMEGARNRRLELAAAEAAAKRAALRAAKQRSLVRVAIALGILLLLLILRQWYVGGRIPILREPEKFYVTPLPTESEKPNQ